MYIGLFWGIKVFLHSVGLRVHLSPQVQLPGCVPTLARELEPFFWIMCTAVGLRPDWWTVAVTHLAFITVTTLMMLESHVKVCVCVCAYVRNILTPKQLSNLSKLLAATTYVGQWWPYSLKRLVQHLYAIRCRNFVRINCSSTWFYDPSWNGKQEYLKSLPKYTAP